MGQSWKDTTDADKEDLHKIREDRDEYQEVIIARLWSMGDLRLIVRLNNSFPYEWTRLILLKQSIYSNHINQREVVIL